MSIEIAIGLPAYNTAEEVYAAKPWLQAGSVVADGGYWRGVDSRDGASGIVGRLGDQALAQLAGNGFTTGNQGFSLFDQTKQGDYYGPIETSSPVDASLLGGGLVPLPGFGALGNGKYNWLLWALVAAGLVLILSKAPPASPLRLARR
ncbi:MAG TPA: hypothetical protein VF194_19690 [Ferrovibrio sp.]|uniref:hypothetical protein n=1 Tax=Ferrovibrio sp. TaxID=1917215 RepID=UPI002ED2B9DB